MRNAECQMRNCRVGPIVDRIAANTTIPGTDAFHAFQDEAEKIFSLTPEAVLQTTWRKSLKTASYRH